MTPKAEEKPVSEYGEPWKEDGCCAWADNGEGMRVADCWTSGKATCDRVVACVNAMQGIPNPEAVRELVEAALSYTRTVEGPSSKADLHRAKVRLDDAVHFLSAPSTGAQKE